MSQPKTNVSNHATDGEDGEPGYIDFSDPAVVKRELKAAFAAYKPPAGGRQGRMGMNGKPPKRRGIAPWKWEENLVVTKFCFERTTKMLTYLGMGMYVQEVCRLVGIRSKTFEQWIARGQDPKQGPYYIFARAVDQIAASFEARHVTNIHQLTFGRDPVSHRRYMEPVDSARMSLQLLKAKFPKRWGDRMDITTDGHALGEERPKRIEMVFVDKDTATPASAAAQAVRSDEDDEA